MKNVLVFRDYLFFESEEYFKKILYFLDILGIKYEVDYLLVRGLDYYDEVVYEFMFLDKNVGV